MDDISVLNLFLEAGLVVKIVMLLLFIASILSWIIIVERYNFFKKIKAANDAFLRDFWTDKDLDILYKEISKCEARRLMSISVQVRGNNVEKALRILKKKLQKDGLMQELRLRQYYEKPTLKRQRKHKESLRRSAKAKRLKFLREISSE